MAPYTRSDLTPVLAAVVIALPLLIFAVAWLYYMFRGRCSMTHLLMFVAYSSFIVLLTQAVYVTLKH